jgi:hypothetical protein
MRPGREFGQPLVRQLCQSNIPTLPMSLNGLLQLSELIQKPLPTSLRGRGALGTLCHALNVATTGD